MSTWVSTAVCTQSSGNKSQRRQNKSCDQCRSGKRRCDVQTFYSRGEFSSTTCSNCAKWKKRCTTHWAQSRYSETSPPSKRRRSNGTSFVSIADDTSFDLEFGTSNTWPDMLSQPTVVPPASVQSEMGSMERIDEYWLNDHVDGCFGFKPQDTSHFFQPSSRPDGGIYEVFSGLPSETLQTTAVREFATGRLETLGVNIPSFGITANDDNITSIESISNDGNTTSTGSTANDEEDDPLMNELHDEQYVAMTVGKPCLTSTLSDIHAKGWLRSGLMKIYHDSLEGALGCWLIARNCPYPVAELDTRDAWSHSWSNRMAKSACALDQYLHEDGYLSDHDRRQGSQVLNLVIMAFAAQWAQSGPRTTARYPGTKQSFQPVNSDPFGGSLQESLWIEANQALSTANNNPSFKAIFAGIIFSLTQRPLIAPGTYNESQSNTVLALHALLGQDETAVFLDIALRKLHSHQRKFKDELTKPLPATHQTTFRLLLWLAVMFDTLSAAMNKKSVVVNDHDSSIDGDQGSLVEDASIITSSFDLNGFICEPEDRTATLPFRPTIWGNYFMRDTQHRKRMAVRWPCTYSEAAMCLADAAPVKVLMFRRVGHLQDLLYQHAAPSVLEEAVSAACDVYHHWNATYGLFINDCIAQHELLPARIQSWYILLAGHWHLAVLLLADLLDKINPSNSGTADIFRQDSVDIVAQLGRVSSDVDPAIDGDELDPCSTSFSSFSQSPQFHHAVNRAALLTEPWTAVLVRVFGKAAELLIHRISLQNHQARAYTEIAGFPGSVRVPHDGSRYDNSEPPPDSTGRQKLKWCLEALWLLGRKSDVAVQVVSLLLKLEAATT